MFGERLSDDTKALMAEVLSWWQRRGRAEYTNTENLTRPPLPSMSDESYMYVCLTPAGGIAARAGQTISFVACELQEVDSTGVMSTRTDEAGTPVTIDVGNLAEGEAVAGGEYIMAMRDMFGSFWCVFEECP